MIIKIIFQLKCTSKKTKGMIKKMKNLKTKAFKSTKGITLIALVVTIIILLILAGVSIAMLTGNNGILTQGKRAKEEQAHAAVKEGIMLLYNEYRTKQEVNSSKVQEETKVASTELVKIAENEGAEGTTENLGSFKDFIQSKNIINANGIINVRNLLGQTLSLGNGTSKESGDVYVFEEQKGIYKISYYTSETVSTSIYQIANEKAGKTLVEMYNQAQKDNCTNSDGSCKKAEHLHIGDYVDYNPLKFKEGTADVDKTASSSRDENGCLDQTFSINTDTKWRVLGKDDNGQILIVSADPVKKDMGDTNNPTPTTNTPYFYLKGAKGYINAETVLERISKIYGHGDGATEARSLKIEDVNKICGVTVGSDGLTPAVDELGNFGTTQSYTDQYASPEDYPGTKSNFSKTSNAYCYEGNNSLLKTATNTRAYETIFFKKQRKKLNWLASRSVYVGSDCAGFCVGNVYEGYAHMNDRMFRSDGDEYDAGFAVRPVVSLKSDVTTDTIPKIADQEEQDWSGFFGCGFPE